MRTPIHKNNEHKLKKWITALNENHANRKRFLVVILWTGFIKILRALQTNNNFILQYN